MTDDLHCFLSQDEDAPLAVSIFTRRGAGFIALEDLMNESIADLSPVMRQRYACAFEVMSKQMRGK